MIDKEKINNMSLEEILLYFNASDAFCKSIEKKITPLYNSTTRDEQEKFLQLKSEHQRIDYFRNELLNEISDKIETNLSK